MVTVLALGCIDIIFWHTYISDFGYLAYHDVSIKIPYPQRIPWNPHGWRLSHTFNMFHFPIFKILIPWNFPYLGPILPIPSCVPIKFPWLPYVAITGSGWQLHRPEVVAAEPSQPAARRLELRGRLPQQGEHCDDAHGLPWLDGSGEPAGAGQILGWRWRVPLFWGFKMIVRCKRWEKAWDNTRWDWGYVFAYWFL